MRWTACGGGREDLSRNIAEPFKFIILGSDTQESNLKYINFEACKRIRASGF
jgi:hypothetical protein